MLKSAPIRLCDQWKMLQCWRRTGYLPSFFVPTPGDWQLKSPHPREFGIQGQKNANARGSARGGGGGSGLGAAGIDWCIILILDTITITHFKRRISHAPNLFREVTALTCDVWINSFKLNTTLPNLRRNYSRKFDLGSTFDLEVAFHMCRI